MKNHLFVKIFVILGMYSSCRDYEECPDSLVINAIIEPSKLEYNVGDTIKIISKFGKWVDGFNSEGKLIGQFNTEGLSWIPVTLISRTDTVEDRPSTIKEYFDFIEDVNYNYHLYTLSDNSSGLDGEYNFFQDTFELKIKLVAKSEGTFVILQKSGIELFGEQDFPGKCPGRGLYGWVNMNEGSKNNIYLLHESPDSTWNYWTFGDSIEYFQHNGGFCFKVNP